MLKAHLKYFSLRDVKNSLGDVKVRWAKKACVARIKAVEMTCGLGNFKVKVEFAC